MIGMIFTATWMTLLLIGWAKWGLIGTIERLIDWTRAFVSLVMRGPNIRFRSTPTHLVIERKDPKCKCGVAWSKHSDSMKERHMGNWVVEVPPSLHSYYGGHEITKAVEDLFSPGSLIVEAVEKQCENELRISKSYREQPELLYAQHPWMTFVRSGDAAYLGWDKNHVPGPSPIERKRMRNGREFSQCRNGHTLPDGTTWCEPCERGDAPGPRPPRGPGGGSRETVTIQPGTITAGFMRLGDEKPDTNVEFQRTLTQLMTNGLADAATLRGLADASSLVPVVVPAEGRVTYKRGGEVEIHRNAAGEVVQIIESGTQVQSHALREVKVNDPDSGEYLGSVGVCECGDCESEPWDDQIRNGG